MFTVPDDIPAPSREIAREAARLEENARYAAQSQFEQAKIWRALTIRLGIPAAVLSAAGGTTVLASAQLRVLAGVITLLGAALAAALTTLGADRRSDRAANAGNAYRDLQTGARQLLLIDLAVLSFDEARNVLGDLTARYAEVSVTAEPVLRRAYRRAQRNISDGGQSNDIGLGTTTPASGLSTA
ncbi:SLATT domain-containing protein [Amycolatopsis tucumanensis]|uniref:SLATT domain-containing protein n=1 Tax=Amycolatopsis tucumanensis TaxID=401106 RepID=A0ABP7HCX5_9PSEU|nr:SLATT domain-containing protein [Amycolatopsis tucumanensis]MCF6423718.1 SLATT domain-containing protein [Amycolatopsis tucumanensis]